MAWTEGQESRSIEYYLAMFTPVIILVCVFGGIMYTTFILGRHWYRKWWASLFCTVELKDSDETFKWVMTFIREQKLVKRTD